MEVSMNMMAAPGCGLGKKSGRSARAERCLAASATERAGQVRGLHRFAA